MTAIKKYIYTSILCLSLASCATYNKITEALENSFKKKNSNVTKTTNQPRTTTNAPRANSSGKIPMDKYLENSSYNYIFSALVNKSQVVNKTIGNAEVPVKQLIVSVENVIRGNEIEPGQDIFIELNSATDDCPIGQFCEFAAPNKHPSFKKAILIIKAVVVK